jgi:cytochrome b subunit of formate dehydrogenase
MTNKKALRLWMVNILSFMLFIMLGITGLINWVILPRGYGARGGVVISLRHFFIEIHEWTALAFILIIAVHVLLHWGYIKANLKKYRR